MGGLTRCKPSRFFVTHATSLRSITVLRALAKGNHSASRRRENGGANEINSMHEDECSLGGDFYQSVISLPESLGCLLADGCDALVAGRVAIKSSQPLWRPKRMSLPKWLICGPSYMCHNGIVLLCFFVSCLLELVYEFSFVIGMSVAYLFCELQVMKEQSL